MNARCDDCGATAAVERVRLIRTAVLAASTAIGGRNLVSVTVTASTRSNVSTSSATRAASRSSSTSFDSDTTATTWSATQP